MVCVGTSKMLLFRRYVQSVYYVRLRNTFPPGNGFPDFQNVLMGPDQEYGVLNHNSVDYLRPETPGPTIIGQGKPVHTLEP